MKIPPRLSYRHGAAREPLLGEASGETLPFSNRAAWSVAISVAVLFFAAPVSRSEGADDLSTRLAQFDAAVLPLKERELAARMVEQKVEQRLKDANERSSATWKSIARIIFSATMWAFNCTWREKVSSDGLPGT